MEQRFCEFCGRDDTYLPDGCPCANGRALPSMTVGAVLDHKERSMTEDTAELDPRDERYGQPPEPPHLIVSEYAVTRHFGGQEEGGWWYDRHEFKRILAVATTEEDTIAVARALNAKAEDEHKEHGRHQGRFSVMGGEDIVYYAERTPAEMDDSNQPRPHYE